MATYLALFDLLSDTNMLKRTQYALMSSARDIRNEAPDVANHANRLVFANRVFSGGLTRVTFTEALREILANSTVAAAGASCTDNDMQFALNQAVSILVDRETS